MTEALLVFMLLYVLAVPLMRFSPVNSRKRIVLLLSALFILVFGWLSLLAIVALCAINFLWARSSVTLRVWPIVLLNVLSIVLLGSSGPAHFFQGSEKGFDSAELPLLLGLSFYSLQHIAYQVDVARERIRPESSFSEFLLTSLYFPKFLAGPVTLYQDLKPQLEFRFSGVLFFAGLNRFVLGLFKKIVIAGRLAPSVTSVFDYQDQLPGITILAGAMIFTLQLYFDFSGYSDMAIGTSRMLGAQLNENFSMPFRATSLTHFWRRWHQSLLRFFTEYLYYPLVFRLRRWGKPAAAIGITVTFLVSGLWHGWGLTFLCWAICHVIYLNTELVFAPAVERRMRSGSVPRVLYALLTFALVSFSNIFFRSPDVESCVGLLSQLFRGPFLPEDWLLSVGAPLAVGGHQGDLFNLYLVLFFVTGYLFFEARLSAYFNAGKLRTIGLYLLLLLVFVFGVFGQGARFIYMQF